MTLQSHFQVLIVEGNPNDRVAIRKELGNIEPRFSLEFTENALQAIDFLTIKKAKGSQFLPKVVILDLKLPGMSGLDLLRYLRSDTTLSSISVIVLTDSKDQNLLFSAFQQNVSGYVLKPARIEELRDALQKISSFLKICEFV